RDVVTNRPQPCAAVDRAGRTAFRGIQRFFEFTLDRAAFLSGRPGLRAVGTSESEYFGFGILRGGESDLFSEGPKRRPVIVLSNCVNCHVRPDVFGIHTFGFSEHEWYSGVAQTDLAAQVRQTVNRKSHSFSWGFLQGLRESTPP